MLRMFYINVETGEVRVNAEAEPLVRRSPWGFSTPPLAHSVQRAACSLQPAQDRSLPLVRARLVQRATPLPAGGGGTL